jgi:hypothetical protein
MYFSWIPLREWDAALGWNTLYRPVSASLHFFGGVALRGQSMTEMCRFEIVDIQKMIGLSLIWRFSQQNRLNCRAHCHIQCPGEANRNSQKILAWPLAHVSKWSANCEFSLWTLKSQGLYKKRPKNVISVTGEILNSAKDAKRLKKLENMVQDDFETAAKCSSRRLPRSQKTQKKWKVQLRILQPAFGYNLKIFTDNFRLTISLRDIIRIIESEWRYLSIKSKTLIVKKYQPND